MQNSPKSSPPSGPIDWDRFRHLVQSHQRFLLTSHVRPDADALGSELGMAGVLEALGKQVRVVNAHAVPPNLQFLDPDHKLKQLGTDIQEVELADTQVIMILDTSAWVQLGEMADVVRRSSALRLVVDHHVSQDDLGAELFKDTQAEATGRLVVDAAQALGVELTPSMAEPLFAALATDTGWFRFPSTTPTTYRTAAVLAEAGARPSAIYRDLYEQNTLGRLLLIGRALTGVVTELQGRLVHTSISLADFEATGALPSDTEDIINMTLQVAGTEVAIIFVEQPVAAGDKVKVSFRSRGTVDCSQLAEQFGGGGHRAAAGVLLPKPLSTAQQQVLEATRAAMQASR